ncbi:probable serine/threonine-protein kinase At1g54610 isoform X2 [Magnolia sinica]|uniref:probable serine/threonine-protein kinase At1g54610 isoform X2 n=1 Tax=Magnolia sinica TaxID=86752 RepID=UPI00265B536C|nr:probable serine/threonine-protein kinase At1g54610 isoform X2 [Magnolia sinica]
MGCVFGRPDSLPQKESDLPSSAAAAAEADRKPSQIAVPNLESGTADHAVRKGSQEKAQKDRRLPRGERRRHRPDPWLSNPPKNVHGEQVAAGWPSWLSAVAGEAIQGWTPRRADSFEKLDKIGQGTYSNVYKARDSLTGKIVALKKVRFDNLEPESVKFMAREILILRKLDHPNVVKLEGLVTSRMSCSLYLVFEYMEHDLAGLAASPAIKFTEPQVKCYMHQLLSGLEHCHNRCVLHRDIKGSNLLLDNGGILKIADFGLASFFDPDHKQPMTSRVVTLWYRPPELLLGATDYGVGVDLWSAGCILAELLAGKPIMPGRTEFFTTEPYACEPSSLPKYPPSKEMDAKLRDEEARRLRAGSGRANGDGMKKTRIRDRAARAMPAPEANAELQANLDLRRRLITHANAKSKSEKFPPPHQDGALGYPLASVHHIDPHFDPPDVPFSSTFIYPKDPGLSTWSGPLVDPSLAGHPRRKKQNVDPWKPPSGAREIRKGSVRVKGKESMP